MGHPIRPASVALSALEDRGQCDQPCRAAEVDRDLAQASHVQVLSKHLQTYVDAEARS